MYNSFVTLCNFLCGAIILDEKSMYTEGELLVQIFLCCICLVGIYILVAKINLDCCKSKRKVPISRVSETAVKLKTLDK